MSSAYNDNFTSSLPIWIPFISFSCLIALTRPSNTMLNRTWWEWDPCSCSRFQWESFQLFITIYYVGCGFVINSFYYAEISSLCTHFDKSFYTEWILNFIKCFFCIYWGDRMVFVLSFVDMVYHIDWRMLNHPCDPGMNPTWLQHMIFSQVFGFGLLIFCWEFLRLYSYNDSIFIWFKTRQI